MKWVRLSGSSNPAIRREAEPLRDQATGDLDIGGIHAAEDGSAYKAYYTGIERDRRGWVHRRQRTKNFPRRAQYSPVTLPDFGRIERPSALHAAYAFKTKLDAAARAGREARDDSAVTVADLFESFHTASRMESSGVPGAIQITGSTYELLADAFVCELRGPVEVKGKGTMETFLLIGLRGDTEHGRTFDPSTMIGATTLRPDGAEVDPDPSSPH